MRVLRWLAGALVWILALVVGLVAGVLCITILLLPLGLPLLAGARRLFGTATKLMLPRAMTSPVEELGRSVRKRGRKARRKLRRAVDNAPASETVTTPSKTGRRMLRWRR